MRLWFLVFALLSIGWTASAQEASKMLAQQHKDSVTMLCGFEIEGQGRIGSYLINETFCQCAFADDAIERLSCFDNDAKTQEEILTELARTYGLPDCTKQNDTYCNPRNYGHRLVMCSDKQTAIDRLDCYDQASDIEELVFEQIAALLYVLKLAEAPNLQNAEDWYARRDSQLERLRQYLQSARDQ